MTRATNGCWASGVTATGGATIRGHMPMVFPEDRGPWVGFPRPEDEHVVDEIVFRELLQNASDAHAKLGGVGAVQVEFVTVTKRLGDIPGINDYRQALGRVVPALTEGTQAEAIYNQILRALRRDRVTCLICRDNGIGIDAEAYQSLLGRGASLNTATTSTSLGSVGVGHLTPLAASSSRYVLYASRRPDAGDRLGGQAFLATHRRGRETYSEQGCITDANQDDDFRASEAELALHPPAWLLGDIARGSAVCVVAYEPIDDRVRSAFNAQPATLGTRIAEIAAKHFHVALDRGALTVSHVDEASGERTEIGVTTDAGRQCLERSMEALYAEQRSPRGNSDLGAGRRAFEARKTWTHGQELRPESALLSGTTIKWRHTPGERTRVTVFRGGMRISDGISQVESDKFGEFNAFNAVVDAGGEFEKALRKCETGTHLRVDVSSRSGAWGRRLKDAFAAVVGELKAVVGERTTTSWEPEVLNILYSDDDPRVTSGRARPAPPLEPTDPLSVEDPPDDDDLDPDEPADPNPPDGPDQPDPADEPDPTDEPSRVRRPPAGAVTPLPSSLVPEADGNVQVIWSLPDLAERSAPGSDEVDRVSVMLVSANGSDSACDWPLRPSYVNARAVNGAAEYNPYVHCEPTDFLVALEPEPTLGPAPTLGVDVWLVRTKR